MRLKSLKTTSKMPEDKDQSLVEHLEALRSTLIKCLVALGVGLVPMFLASPYVIKWLIAVMIGTNEAELNYFAPMEVFILQIKTAAVLDLAVCFPYVARKIWLFVLPGLYDNERKFVRSIVLSSASLFVIGVAFCIFFISPLIINFGLSFASDEIRPMFGISNVISLGLWLAVVFGVMFQFPLVTYSLIKFGVASYETVRAKRPYVLVGVLIVAAILTPPDIISQLMLAVPTYLLFEAALWCAKGKNKESNKLDIFIR